MKLSFMCKFLSEGRTRQGVEWLLSDPGKDTGQQGAVIWVRSHAGSSSSQGSAAPAFFPLRSLIAIPRAYRAKSRASLFFTHLAEKCDSRVLQMASQPCSTQGDHLWWSGLLATVPGRVRETLQRSGAGPDMNAALGWQRADS